MVYIGLGSDSIHLLANKILLAHDSVQASKLMKTAHIKKANASQICFLSSKGKIYSFNKDKLISVKNILTNVAIPTNESGAPLIQFINE